MKKNNIGDDSVVYELLVKEYDKYLNVDLLKVLKLVKDKICFTKNDYVRSFLKNNKLVYMFYYMIIPLFLRRNFKKKDILLVSFAQNHLNVLIGLYENGVGKISVTLNGKCGYLYLCRKKNECDAVLLDSYVGLIGFLKVVKFMMKIKKIRKKILRYLSLNVEEKKVLRNIEMYTLNWYRFTMIGENISSKFKKVIFGNDSCHRAIGLIKSCREKEIQTGVVQHGVIANVQKYLPNSDVMYVWGEIEKEKLVEKGVSRNKIVVAGYPYNNYDISKSVRLGGDIFFPTTSIIDRDIMRNIINLLYEYSKRGKKVVIRPHPHDDILLYKKYKQNSFFIINNKDELLEQIEKSGIGIFFNSTVGLQMAMKGLRVIKLNISEYHDESKYNDFQYIKKIYSIAELDHYLTKGMYVEKVSDDDRIHFISSYIKGEITRLIKCIV